jgi:hypothetical protein
MREHVERAMGDLFRRSAEQASTRVDVATTHDDSELDDHLWNRLSAQLGSEDELSVHNLPAHLRSYYVTRFFEWERDSGGPTGFLAFGSQLGQFVSAGYRHLDLHGAADAFDRFWSLPTVHRLREDDAYLPSDDEDEVMHAAAEAVGTHDAERIAFVRRHGEAFSI